MIHVCVCVHTERTHARNYGIIFNADISTHPPTHRWGGLGWGVAKALLAGHSTQNTAHEGDGGGGKNAHRNICTRTNTQPLCFDILSTHTTDPNSTRPSPDSHHLPPCLPPRGELKNTRID